MFVRNIPKPPKYLCKTFCAIMPREDFEADHEHERNTLICGITENDVEPQAVLYHYSALSSFLTGFECDDWEMWVEEQALQSAQ